MKVIYSLIILLIIAFGSCQEDNASLNSSTGYLRLTVSESEDVNTRAYNPEQIQVIIREKESKKEVKSTDDWTNWEGESIELSAGEYTIIAKSYEYDNERGFDKPYYYGSQDVTIEAGKENNATVTCKLANVKVTVQYDAALLKALEGHTYSVEVGSSEAGSNIAPLTFDNDEKRAAYFPVSDLYAKITIDGSESQTLMQDLENVKARDHYILNYKLTDKGSSNITVAIDPTHNEYAYTFEIDMTPISVTADFEPANAWATFAYLKASNVESTSTTVDPTNVSFQYRKKGAIDWVKIETFHDEDGIYTARPTGLEGATEYEYCLTVGNENTSAETFVTDNATELYNGNFDKWYQNEKTIYAGESGISFWDSSNPGTTTGAGAIVNKNPTYGVTSPLHTEGSNLQAACLKSEHISVNAIIMTVEKFAAASLYTGSFGGLVGMNGAKINFGQPFTARPISLHGFFQYAPAKIDEQDVGNSGVLKAGDTDICSIYIALSKKVYTVDNTDTNTFIDFEGDNSIIAYGELPIDQCVNTNGSWKEFDIPLKYKNLTEKPAYIIIVCSASKYGDYFTGGHGSTMYLDDFELIYDGEPTIWE